MRTHELKTVQPWFDRLWDGSKTAELRLNDRDFHAGDALLLRELNGRRWIKAAITDVCGYPEALQRGYVMLSFRVLERSTP